MRVRASFDNKDGALIPGQFARIRMGQARNDTALLVSERAIGTDQNKKFVMVVGEDNKAVYREVALGRLPTATGRGRHTSTRPNEAPVKTHPVRPAFQSRFHERGERGSIVAESA